MTNAARTLAAVSLLASAGVASAQLHDADFIIRVTDGAFEAGRVINGDVAWGERLFAGEFGREGVPNVTNDPGVDSPSGGLPSGLRVNIDITAALRWWNGSNFDTIPAETVVIEKSRQTIETPATDTLVTGLRLGTSSSNGGFHHHATFFLDHTIGFEGVWLVSYRLSDADGVIEPSEPLYVVFRQGNSQVAAQDEAMQWVRDNLLGSPCLADFTGDGTTDFFDVAAFLDAFSAMNPVADLTNDGIFDFFDVSIFLQAFSNGCP